MKVFYSTLLALLITLSGVHSHAAPETLSPERSHQITTLEIIRKLQTRHLEKRELNDALSVEFFNNYLSRLDNNKHTFLQSEVDALYKKYAKRMDNTLKEGNLSPGFNIFNQYRMNNIALLESFIETIPEKISSFDYSSNETVQMDRSEANWPKTQAERQQLWDKRLKAASLSLKLAGREKEEVIDLLTRRYSNQLERMKDIRSDDVFQLYINAFTELYDPHTGYMSPAVSENFDISMSLKLEGIGAMLRKNDEYTEVVRLIHAGPAHKQGELQPADRIIAVAQGKEDFVDVVGWRLDEVVQLIRGPKGSTVRLEVIPANAIGIEERRVITIVREEVKLEEQSVQKAMLNIEDSKGTTHKIGVLNIPAFYIDFEALRQRDPNFKSATRDAARLLSELIREGAEGIIIDLRGNGGGSLREANELTGLFIEKGPSVQIRHANNRVYSEAKNYYTPYYDGPVVILIDRMSASASEIFAGAMQDYQRAVIIGSQSFGKGTVQSLSPLSHGKLKITESRFYRISGDGTQNRGVIPDIPLPDLFDPKLIGESALDKPIPWDAIDPVNYQTYYNLDPIMGELKILSQDRAANNPKFNYISQKAEYEKTLRTDSLSLNKKQRQQEREKDRAARLAMLNQKRKSQGLEPLDALNEQSDEDEENKEPLDTSKVSNIDLDDPYLKEAANVLLDLTALLNRPKIADDKKTAANN